jgi:polyisoprenoid-binding protein YceI
MTWFDTSLVVNPCVYILTLPVLIHLLLLTLVQGLTTRDVSKQVMLDIHTRVNNKRCIKTGNVRIYTQGLTTRDVSKQVMLDIHTRVNNLF